MAINMFYQKTKNINVNQCHFSKCYIESHTLDINIIHPLQSVWSGGHSLHWMAIFQFSNPKCDNSGWFYASSKRIFKIHNYVKGPMMRHVVNLLWLWSTNGLYDKMSLESRTIGHVSLLLYLKTQFATFITGDWLMSNHRSLDKHDQNISKQSFFVTLLSLPWSLGLKISLNSLLHHVYLQ